MMNEEKENIRIYERMRDELIQSQRSNSENFDKAILSLSSAGLGITVSFITNLIDLSESKYTVLLYLTWAFFIIAIISTILSFLVSQNGISKQLNSLENIYINKVVVDTSNIDRISNLLNRLNILSAISFVSAVIILIIFSITNISKGAIKMSNNNKPIIMKLTEGAAINKLQKTVNTDVQKGMPINILQPVAKPNSQTSSVSNSSSDSAEKK